MELLEQDIKQIVLDNQQLVVQNSFFRRELRVERLPRKATIITGIRRAGKSVYMMLYLQSLVANGVSSENFCILDFSDDRLYRLRSEEPSVIADSYYALFPEKTNEKVYFFFDEIQYLHHWQLFVNRLQTTRNCEVNITGSSAKLLVKEISTEFGGRSLSWELFPFSFSEFVATKGKQYNLPDFDHMTSDDSNYCRSWFRTYMKIGGFPESLMIQNERTRIRFLQDIAQSVVFRDVIQRYRVTDTNAILRLMQMLLNQMGGLTSLRKLKQRMAGERYRISIEMIRQAIIYFEDAYLLYPVEIFSLNSAVRSNNPKKIYCVDHALAMSISEKLTPDYGKILENIVFIYLRHYTDRIYYARTKHGREIDFVTMASGTVMSEHTSVHLWQVCYELDDIDTLNRELEALKDVENSYVISKATIVTYDTEGYPI
ncbi:MAG: ATP-binding protein [Spirochaetia bacterium]|jgi:predicted AAA+ superfamily ATPase|nr:ATP-binding protein [Spirochaetia bacterium]